MKYSGRQATREGAVGKGASWGAVVSHFKCILPINPFALLSPLQYFM
jgi:hypothetical protein